MDCRDAQDLVHAYLDGELDVAGARALEQHLHECPTCTQLHRRHQELSTRLQDGSLHFTPPTGLERRIRAALPRARPFRRQLYVLGWRIVGVAAGVAFVAVTSWNLALALHRPAAEEELAREIIAGHVRALQADHLTDVASSDQHTVKPWFAGKLDFSPVVVDLAEQGFPLVGGRLDYLEDHAVAALVYHRRQHTINLFIWPTADAPAAARTLDRHGYHVIHWAAGGLTYWAVSDVQVDDLAAFAEAYRASLASHAPA